MTNQDIKTVGQTIAQETQIGGNTAARVGGVVEGIGVALDNKDAANGYYQATINGGTITVNAPNYLLGSGGNLRIKMPSAGTTASTLTIGNANAVQLWYNGAAVSEQNTWEADEIISVFYDGTRFMASNSQGGGGKAEKIKYDNSQSGLAATDVQGALDEIFGDININDYSEYGFELGTTTDDGQDKADTSGKYFRTPANSPIILQNGKTTNIDIRYRNSSDNKVTSVITRLFEYLDGVYVRTVSLESNVTNVDVLCDGTFNQIRVRGYKSSASTIAPYSSVLATTIYSLKETREQVTKNTNEINDLKKESLVLDAMEEETINKSIFTSVDLTNVYYRMLSANSEYAYENTSNYCYGIKIPLKCGDHVVLYTKGTDNCRPWVIIDQYRYVLGTSDSLDYLTNPAEFDVDKDCYLCANMYSGNSASTLAKFNLTITSSPKLQYTGIVSEISKLNNRAPIFKNNPFPMYRDNLKILMLGNSFALNTTAFINNFIDAASLDKNKMCCYVTYVGGSSLEDYVGYYDSDRVFTGTEYIRRAGNIDMIPTIYTLKGILSQDWDIIIVQQVSTLSYQWPTYIPSLPKLVSDIKNHNPLACIGFLMAWSTRHLTDKSSPSSTDKYILNCDCAKKVMQDIGVDLILPIGTAIENARNTSLNDSKDLLDDGRHLNTGIGYYIAGAAFWETILSKFYGVSIVGNSLTVNPSDGTPVTDNNKLLCQQCAHASIVDMWDVTNGLE